MPPFLFKYPSIFLLIAVSQFWLNFWTGYSYNLRYSSYSFILHTLLNEEKVNVQHFELKQWIKLPGQNYGKRCLVCWITEGRQSDLDAVIRVEKSMDAEGEAERGKLAGPSWPLWCFCSSIKRHGIILKWILSEENAVLEYCILIKSSLLQYGCDLQESKGDEIN